MNTNQQLQEPHRDVDDWRARRDARQKEIGFPEDRRAFKTAQPVFDQANQTLKVYGQPVMERWEEPYMAMLAEIATRRGGRVLEVGFGMGISAGFIQQHSPSEHVVIEANAAIARMAREFTTQHAPRNRITVLEGFWEDVVPGLPRDSFDGILFDTYPLNEEEQVSLHASFIPHAYRLLKPGGILTFYSDEPTDLGSDVLAVLHSSGFTKIRWQLCQVAPPPDCEYWSYETIVAPIIEK